jgi:hypothetical protein
VELTFEVEDLVLDELAVTTIGDAAAYQGDVVPASCSCCTMMPHGV